MFWKVFCDIWCENTSGKKNGQLANRLYKTMPLNIWFLHFNLPNQQGWGDNHGVLFFQIRIIISLVPQGGLVCEECPLDLIMISYSSPSDLFGMRPLGGLVLRKAFKPRGHSSHTRPPCGTRLFTQVHCTLPWSASRFDKVHCILTSSILLTVV